MKRKKKKVLLSLEQLASSSSRVAPLSDTIGKCVSGVWAETQAYAAHLHNFTKSFIYKIERKRKRTDTLPEGKQHTPMV